MTRRTRVVAAVLLSPMVGALSFLVCWFLVVFFSAGEIWLPREQFGAAFGWFVLFPLAVGFVAELILGLPLLKLLLALRWLDVWGFGTAGFIVGLMVMLMLYWGEPPSLAKLTLCVGPSVLAAVAFGLISGFVEKRGAQATSTTSMAPQYEDDES